MIEWSRKNDHEVFCFVFSFLRHHFELMATLLLQPPEYWDFRHAILNSADCRVARFIRFFKFYFISADTSYCGL